MTLYTSGDGTHATLIDMDGNVVHRWALPNGNRLINESDGGRLFEVTPEGGIVWEFINPVREGDSDQYIPVVSSGQRFAYDYFDADFRAVIGNH